MQQRYCQLNKYDWTFDVNGHIFASPMTKNIVFSCNYLKHTNFNKF